MSFSYQLGANPIIDYPRILCRDTDPTRVMFQDEEIRAIANIETFAFQSGMFYTFPGGANLPSAPIPYRRIAATMLDAVAADNSRLAAITGLLDVKLDPGKTAEALSARARELRETDDNNGAFMIVEQVTNWFSFRDRFWSQIQRQCAA